VSLIALYDVHLSIKVEPIVNHFRLICQVIALFFDW